MSVVEGVPGAICDSFDTYKSASTLYTAAFGQGLVRRVVEVGGIYDDDVKFVSPRQRRRRRSSKSSLWDKVSDINDATAFQMPV